MAEFKETRWAEKEYVDQYIEDSNNIYEIGEYVMVSIATNIITPV